MRECQTWIVPTKEENFFGSIQSNPIHSNPSEVNHSSSQSIHHSSYSSFSRTVCNSIPYRPFFPISLMSSSFSSSSSSLRFLCLHGFYQSATLSQLKTGALRKVIKNVATIEYIQAPHEITNKDEFRNKPGERKRPTDNNKRIPVRFHVYHICTSTHSSQSHSLVSCFHAQLIFRPRLIMRGYQRYSSLSVMQSNLHCDTHFLISSFELFF